MTDQALPLRPLVAVYARDWMMEEEPRSVHADFRVATGWCVGWLVKETEDALSIAMEYFDDEETVRHVQTYPKETVLQIVYLEPKLIPQTREANKSL